MPVNIIDTLKPKNGGSFPIVEAIDVFVEGYTNLADAVSHFATDAMIQAINAVLSGKANTSDVNTSVANLQGQIDQIVISASAESVVAPEVAAARVGADGTSYSTLKERLDADSTKATAEISGIGRIIDGIIDVDFVVETLTMTNNKVIDATTGEVTTVENQYSFVSDYVDLTGYSMCKISAQANRSNYVYAFYDSTYHFIAGLSSASGESRTVITNEVVKIPAVAKYIVLSQRYSDIPASLGKGDAYPKGINEIEETVSDISDVVGDISEPSYDLNVRGTMTKYGTDGYISSDSGTFVPYAGYQVYYTTIPSSGELWLDDITAFAQVAIYSGEFLESELLQIGSTTYDTLPTVNNKMTVAAGQTVVVSSKNDFVLHTPDGYQAKYTPTAIQIRLVKVDDTHLNIYVPSIDGTKTIKYEFIRYQKTWSTLSYLDGNGDSQTASNVVSSDYWNNIEVYDATDGSHIAQGNSNFITKVTGADAHAGDGHGNEVMLYYAFMCDGNIVNVESMQDGDQVLCSVLRYISNSNVFSVGSGSGNVPETAFPELDTSGNPIVNFIHKMEMSFEIGNRITINNKLIVKQNRITFNQCHGAMLECNYGDFSNVVCNNDESTRNIVNSEGTVTVPPDSTINLRTDTSQKANYVEMYGGKFFIRQKMQQDDSTRDSKSRIVFEFYNNRLKCYLQPVIASYGKLSGETVEEFNAGDVISVTNTRIIE